MSGATRVAHRDRNNTLAQRGKTTMSLSVGMWGSIKIVSVHNRALAPGLAFATETGPRELPGWACRWLAPVGFL
jgi:hypothetical protein